MSRAIRLALLGAVAFVGLLTTRPARADVIYSNFGPDPGFFAFFVWGFGTDPFFDPPFWDDVAYAVPFTPQADARLDAYRVVVGWIWGTNLLNLTLMTDDGGLPGTAIEQVTLVDAMPDLFEPAILTIPSVLHPLLRAGTPYWVVLDAPDPTTFAGWFITSSFEVGRWAESDMDGPFYEVFDWLPALEVTGRIVPEPSALALVTLGGLGLLGLGRIGRKHRASRQAALERLSGSG
jgi:hypothetical protein